jgi:predicted O-methyltransferase YrrM
MEGNTTDYQFTKDWFHWAPEVWEQLIPMLPERKAFLEIGSFEGRSTVWIIENMMEDGGFIDCIDTWGGGEEHDTQDMGSVEARFEDNVEAAMRKFTTDIGVDRWVAKLPGKSTDKLAVLITQKDRYDFIYIDGSHIAKDVLTDACMAWPLLKAGGIMVFDDYMWGEPRDILHRPKLAIDAFCNIFVEEVEVVFAGYQLVVRKKGDTP